LEDNQVNLYQVHKPHDYEKYAAYNAGFNLVVRGTEPNFKMNKKGKVANLKAFMAGGRMGRQAIFQSGSI
jgi:hypothetical protein